MSCSVGLESKDKISGVLKPIIEEDRLKLVCEFFEKWPPGLPQIINSYWSFSGKFISLIQFRNESEGKLYVGSIFAHDFGPDGLCYMNSNNSDNFKGVNVWNTDMTLEKWSAVEDPYLRKIVCGEKLDHEKKYYIALVTINGLIIVYNNDKREFFDIRGNELFSNIKINSANEICIGDYNLVHIYDIRRKPKSVRDPAEMRSLFSQNFVNIYSWQREVDRTIIKLSFFDTRFRHLKIDNLPVGEPVSEIKSVNFSSDNYIYICTSLVMYVICVVDEKCVMSWKLKYPIKEKHSIISFDNHHVYVHDNFTTEIQKYLKYKPDS